jgi:hypothetical protein
MRCQQASGGSGLLCILRKCSTECRSPCCGAGLLLPVPDWGLLVPLLPLLLLLLLLLLL